ncbi:MAG: OsmC family protein [Verrucomicrobiota bacterium]|nr:OsmC family protein [Verrucomicrobiota bacterium]
MKRSATAVWDGEFKGGKGNISTESGVLKQSQYSFGTRFETGIGTNPEELIAAAHAGCFSMALAAFLGKAGFAPKQLQTKASVTIEQMNGSWTITTIDLDLQAQIPGIDQAKFEEIAADAKANCPVSRVLNAEIRLTSRLIS